MKTFFVRSFVLTLALTGFVASTQAAPSMKTSVASVNTPGAQVIPPNCMPGDPDGCGVD
jgi:hypothetical protein